MDGCSLDMHGGGVPGFSACCGGGTTTGAAASSKDLMAAHLKVPSETIRLHALLHDFGFFV